MLGFCANALVFQLAVDFPLHTLGIDFSFFDFFCFNWRAEFQLMPVFEQKIIHFIIFRLCAERNLADLIFVAVYSIKQSYPKRIFKQNFLELGQAIQNAREKQRITREELAEELGISARHLQSIEKEGQYPSFPLFIQLVTMFHISVDQYIHPESPAEKSTLRQQLDALFDTFGDLELTIIAGTAQGICKAKEPEE